MASWFPTRAAGFVVSHTEWNSALAAMADWLGNVNAGGYSLSNVGAFNGATATLTGLLTGTKFQFTSSLGVVSSETDAGWCYLRSGGGVGDAKLLVGVGSTGSYMQSMATGTAWDTKPLVLQPNGGKVGIGSAVGSYRLNIVSAGSDHLSLTDVPGNGYAIYRHAPTGTLIFNGFQQGFSAFRFWVNITGAVEEVFTIQTNGRIYVKYCPTYANDVAAGAAGLAAGELWKTSDGIIRIKL
jgi:hypothetical protein